MVAMDFFCNQKHTNRLNFPWQSSWLKFDNIMIALRNHLRHSYLLEVQDSAIRHLNNDRFDVLLLARY